MYSPKSRLKNVFEAAVQERENMFTEHLAQILEELWWKRNLKADKVCQQISQYLLFRTTGMQDRRKT